ncbi:MAG: four helix bundle protein [Bacteroidales bacterium]|nr:four helix bundle protein [Bacteroidales bacterium]
MYKKNNIIYQKSFDFALDIVKLYKLLIAEKKEYVLSRQILKSGTSIGANVREADNAESKADFIHKMSIAQKEADETIYWIELLYASEFIEKSSYDKLSEKAIEIIKIIKAIIITSKKSLKGN